MGSPTKHLLGSYEPNDPHIINEETEHEGIPCSTVTPYILKKWKENMIFWKNHDTCRRMFNWVREVLGNLDENFLKKIFNKLLHDGELVNDHVRMYLLMRDYKTEGREIIDNPYWMHAALLQVMHLVYLDDDIMLSEPIEELTRPRLQHKNAEKITIMLDIFYEYVSERPFLMSEFPMKNWRNNVDYVDDAGISADNCIAIDEDCAENKKCCNVNLNDKNLVLSVDNIGCSQDSESVLTKNLGDGDDIQSCLNGINSNSSPSSGIEINDSCADSSTDCPLNDEGAAYTANEEDESARLVDFVSTKDLNINTNNQLATASLMEAHPSWDSLVFRTSRGESTRKTNLRVSAKEKAQFNTLVFNNFFNTMQENVPLTSKMSSKELEVKDGGGIFFGLTVFFKDRALEFDQNLKALITSNGGKVCEKLKKTVTHIVASKPIPWYTVGELRRNTNCRVVKPEWILECLRIGKRVNEDTFNMVGLQQAQPTILSFLNGGPTNDQPDSADDPSKIKRSRQVNDCEENGKSKRRRINGRNTSKIQSPAFNRKINKEESGINKYGLVVKKSNNL